MSTDDSTTRLMKTVVATFAMLVIGLLVAPTLSSWHSRHLAARLAQRIADTEDVAVKVPLRQLASLGETAIEPLIVAAASERAAVATIARQILDEKLAVWEIRVKSSETSTVIFASALAAHINEFGPAGKQWAERIALAMIDDSDNLPARQTDVLLGHCSQILAAVPPRGPRLRTLTTRTEIAALPAMAKLSAPEPKLEPLTQASEASLEIMARLQPRVPTEIQNQLTQVVPRSREAGGSASKPLDWSARSSVEFQTQSPLALSAPSEKKLPKSKLTIAPKPPHSSKIGSSNIGPGNIGSGNKGVVDIPTPQDMASRTATLRRLSSEELLLRLPEANFYEAGVLRAVLVERGFDDAELAVRQQLASSNVADRLRIVEDLSQLPATTAQNVLRWLLEDESGEVRLRALTALATTNAADLAELARELAVRDEDPRVAKLASRLMREVR